MHCMLLVVTLMKTYTCKIRLKINENHLIDIISVLTKILSIMHQLCTWSLKQIGSLWKGFPPPPLLGSSTIPQICSSIWGLGLSWNIVIGLYNNFRTLQTVAQWLGKIRSKWSIPPFLFIKVLGTALGDNWCQFSN